MHAQRHTLVDEEEEEFKTDAVVLVECVLPPRLLPPLPARNAPPIRILHDCVYVCMCACVCMHACM